MVQVLCSLINAANSLTCCLSEPSMTNLAGLGDETFNPFGIFNFGVKGKPIFKLIISSPVCGSFSKMAR